MVNRMFGRKGPILGNVSEFCCALTSVLGWIFKPFLRNKCKRTGTLRQAPAEGRGVCVVWGVLSAR